MHVKRDNARGYVNAPKTAKTQHQYIAPANIQQKARVATEVQR